MMIHESAEDYSAITVPYIESASFNLQVSFIDYFDIFFLYK